ncbi:MAG: peptide-methionine (S)-S-oxide reductase MsrA [Solirubrobacterales bacterium]|nr:peptide-methionine (S)-S-oxide reductase MsrA [Solirubrobacterales bacterium]
MDNGMRKATFAAGCFWGVEIDFANTIGVTATRVGYLGGSVDEPSYEDVCTGRTGHAEAVELEFDPERVSYDELVQRFLALHDPTQRDRQGPDVGSQYRSAVFAHTPEQAQAARRVIAANQERFGGRIVTEVDDAGAFWPAEEYHQRYLERRGMATCAVPARVA